MRARPSRRLSLCSLDLAPDPSIRNLLMKKLTLAAFGFCTFWPIGSPIAAEVSPAISWNCSGCHGFEGASVGPLIPSIGGMNARFLFHVMRGYQLDERPSTIMGRIAKGYTTRELRAIAHYFAQQPWRNAEGQLTGSQLRQAQALHHERCADCHDDDGRYQDHEIPRLAGQLPAYLGMQLRDYRDRGKKVPQPEKMRKQVKDLTDAEIRMLSHFYAQVRHNEATDPN